MQLGDTVFVTVSDGGEVDTVCPAIVTKVWTEEDSNGDSQWWNAVKDKGLVSLVAFLSGPVPLVTFEASVKAVSYKDDAGRTRIQHGTYQERVQSSKVVTTPQVPPVPQAPQGPLDVPVPTPTPVPQDTGTVTDASSTSDGWTLTPPTPAS